MASVIQARTPDDAEVQPKQNLVLLLKPPLSENQVYQEFLSELQSYACGYWRWLRKPRIREVFIVNDISNPTIGRIDRIAIKRKAADFIELKNRSRFDINTGRSLFGQPKYIFPVEDRRVQDAWEPQPLWQRVEAVLSALRFADVRTYADLLSPGWSFGVFTEKSDRLFGRNFDRAAALLTECQASGMVACWKCAKEAILGHLPKAIEELRALVDMMEADAK